MTTDELAPGAKAPNTDRVLIWVWLFWSDVAAALRVCGSIV